MDTERRFCMAPQGKIVFLSWQFPYSLDGQDYDLIIAVLLFVQEI